MAAKKYLSLEEAAAELGLRTDEVIRLREKGDLRGFADRGTWKFKADDVEEAKRRRHPDSNPDVPLYTGEDPSALSFDEDLGAQATIVRGGSTSDSDVRLVMDAPLTGSSAELPILAGPGSDSDVRLVATTEAKPLKGSDSDVKLIKPRTSDSKIQLSDSDSDVRLAAGSSGSDSDVKLVPSKTPGESSIIGDVPPNLDLGDSVLLDADSGISVAGDSGIGLAGDSGIRLAGSSSLKLTGDSGIRLMQPADSGILLEGPGDSGIRLHDTGASGLLGPGSSFKLAGGGESSKKIVAPKKAATPLTDDDLNVTAPMLLPSDEGSRTDPDVPMLFDDGDQDLMPKPKKKGLLDTHEETSVIMLDEDDDEESVPLSRGKKPASLSTREFDAQASDFDTEAAETEDDEELEVSDEALGAEDELEEMEVFESEDSDFDESFSEGASSTDFSPGALGKFAVPEAEWGGGTVAFLGVTSVALVLGAAAAVDLLRAVWSGGAPVDAGLAEMMSALFK